MKPSVRSEYRKVYIDEDEEIYLCKDLAYEEVAIAKIRSKYPWTLFHTSRGFNLKRRLQRWLEWKDNRIKEIQREGLIELTRIGQESGEYE